MARRLVSTGAYPVGRGAPSPSRRTPTSPAAAKTATLAASRRISPRLEPPGTAHYRHTRVPAPGSRARVRQHSSPKALRAMLPAASMTGGQQQKTRPSPPAARAPARRGIGLLCGAWVLAVAAASAAQEPKPQPSPEVPELPPDELDFQGLTSITLGSGARAFGMGGAFLARADDATAASWNPAGLSYLRNPEISIVGARNSFDRGPEGGEANDTFVGRTPDFAAVAYPVEFGSV